MKKIIVLLSSLLSSLVYSEDDKIKILAPSTPSSIPLVNLVKNNKNFLLKIYTNHDQANASFIKGDADILFTGMSLAMSFSAQKMPIKIISSHVSGINYLISRTKKLNSFLELKGQKIFLPFEGSPNEEIIKYLSEKNNIKWKVDLLPVYTQFPSMLEMMRKGGDVNHAVMPEPFVSELLIKSAQTNIFYISFDLKEEWEKLTQNKNIGYPQVVSIAKKDFISKHVKEIKIFTDLFNTEILNCEKNKKECAKNAESFFNFKSGLLEEASIRSHFYLLKGQELKQQIISYYKNIGKELNYEQINCIYEEK